MALLKSERDALSELISSYDQTAFDAILFQAGGHKLSDFSSALRPMPVVAANFINWLDQKPQFMSAILELLLNEHPRHSSAGQLQAALDRLADVPSSPIQGDISLGTSTLATQAQLERAQHDAGDIINRLKRAHFRDEYIEGIHNEIADIARSYNWTPPSKVVETVLPVWRELTPRLQGDRHPKAESALFTLAGQVQGLLSYAALYVDETHHARAFAKHCLDLAELANSDHLKAWACGTLSMLYRFDDLDAEALSIAERGLLTTSIKGQLRSRLYSAAAESAAKLGKEQDTIAYLAKGEEECGNSSIAEALQLPGIFEFSEGKVRLYAGTALLEIDNGRDTARRSEEESQRAADLFADPQSVERSHPDLLIAQGHLARARMQLRDLDGAVAALRPMLLSPHESRTSWHRKLLRRILRSANADPFSASRLSEEIREMVVEFERPLANSTSTSTESETEDR